MSTRQRLTAADIEAGLREGMHAGGVPIDEPLILDGKRHRFTPPGDKKGSNKGFYVAHGDGVPTVTFEWHGRVERQNFSLRSAATLTPEERTEFAKRVEASNKLSQRDDARRRNDVAAKAVTIWNKATAATADASYLIRKGVGPHGLRIADWCKYRKSDAGQWIEQTYTGALLVPIYNIKGELRNLQAILPDKSLPGERDKDFLSGGEKKGCFSFLGTPESGRPLLVCEGFATGASLHECTGHAVAIAFDCGNLGPVALALRVKYPDAVLLIAGDNDVLTKANPGAKNAREAAEATGSRWCVADFSGLDESGKPTDFNDLHTLAGVAAVAGQILAALDTDACAPVENARPPASVPPSKSSRFSWNPPGLLEGLYFTGLTSTGEAKEPLWIAGVFDTPACTCATDSVGWGVLCVFVDRRGITHRVVVTMEMLMGDGLDALRLLARNGLRISPRGKPLVVEYLMTVMPMKHAYVARRTGWQDVNDGSRVFLLPDGPIGSASEEEWIYEGNAEIYRTAGTLAQWRDAVALPCSGNSRLLFVVSVAFAAPLLRFVSTDTGGGFHFMGASSLGKTLLLKLCASVIGSPEKVPKWNASNAGLEGLATAYCDAALPLDEISMVDPKQAATAAYLLASGQERARGRAEGGLRVTLSWMGMLVSTGEVSLAQHIQTAGGRNNAGQEVRLCDLPASASDLGVFDTIHALESSKALHDKLSRAVSKYHGTAFIAWLEWLVKADLVELGDFVNNVTVRFKQDYLSPAASGQVHRVADRFALVGVAGELATIHGLTGWEPGEALKAAGRLLKEWLEGRGGEGQSEEREMLRQVRMFMQKHAEGRFTQWSRTVDPHAPKTLHRAGFSRITAATQNKDEKDQELEYLISSEVWKFEVCQGFDHLAVVRLMCSRGFMPDIKSVADRLGQSRETVPGSGRQWFYKILPEFNGADIE
jgi:putative DNA primase/helicase